MAAPRNEPRHRVVVGSLAFTFLSFAIPVSMFGVIWPDVRERFGQSLGALGVVSLVYGLARMSTSGSGRAATTRFSIGACIVAALAGLVAVDLVVATSTTWPIFLVGVAGVGLVSGLLDSVGAGVLATIGEVGSAGLVHGAYGVGATLGPLVVVVIDDWRWSLAATAVVAIAAAAVAVAARHDWPPPPPAPSSRSTAPPRRATTISLLVFGLFVAVEVTMGQWLFTYLTDGRGVGDTIAAVGVAGFWGGTTVGRLLLANPVLSDGIDRIGLPACVAVAGALYVGVAFVPGWGIIVCSTSAGLLLSPLVPTLAARTARRVGTMHAQRVSGWQLLAANVGAISVPAGTGLLVDWVDPQVVVLVVGGCLAAGFPVLLAARHLPDLTAN
ncbi:MAG: MFS transporter [Ilumatobacter sp.]|uniref:MFS transporter n=1 Tax=Ilumatobacter sp. TaxID=1967498 RepID=UPI0039192E37